MIPGELGDDLPNDEFCVNCKELNGNGVCKLTSEKMDDYDWCENFRRKSDEK